MFALVKLPKPKFTWALLAATNKIPTYRFEMQRRLPEWLFLIGFPALHTPVTMVVLIAYAGTRFHPGINPFHHTSQRWLERHTRGLRLAICTLARSWRSWASCHGTGSSDMSPSDRTLEPWAEVQVLIIINIILNLGLIIFIITLNSGWSQSNALGQHCWWFGEILWPNDWRWLRRRRILMAN